MSTSPSWFDKDKFSRLVKKPGPKVGANQPLPTTVAVSQRLVSPIVLKKAEVLAETPEKKESKPLSEKAASPVSAGALPPAAEAPSQSGPSPAAPVDPVKKLATQNMMTSQPLSLGKGPIDPLPPALVTPPSPEPIRAPAETSNISLTSKAPSLEFPLPTLPRRTAPLPALKSIFQYEVPATTDKAATTLTSAPKSPPPLRAENLTSPAPVPEEEKKSVPPPLPVPGEKPELVVSGQLAQSSEDLALAWEKIAQLNEDLRKANQSRDQAVNENGLLREQLKQADAEVKVPELKPDVNLGKIIQERDALTAKVEEIGHAVTERDQIRREYMELRGQFEAMKQVQIHGGNDVAGMASAGLTQQLEIARQQLTEREQVLESFRTEAHGMEEELRRQLDEKSQEISTLKTAAQTTEEDLRNQLDERSKEIESHKSQAGGAEEDLRRQLAERDKEIENLKTSAQSTEVDLRKQLDERGKEIESHKSQAGGAEEDLRRQLTDKEKEIEMLKIGSSGVENELRRQLADKEKEFEVVKADSTGLQETAESLKEELTAAQDQLKALENTASSAALQEQIAQVKEEASISQRGLTLSQKALQETREALREAQEISAQSKVSLENLKRENSTLVQQNMLFQAQNDQISRELSAAKAKRAAKG